MPAPHVVSVNIGQRRVISVRGKSVDSGIYKSPVSERQKVGPEGLLNDERVDPRRMGECHHAVYAYPADHYDYWRTRFGIPLRNGHFGENLTVSGMLETETRMGDIFRCGSTLLQVAQPRIPCRKLDARMGFRFAPTFLQSRRIGYYFRVLQSGTLGPNDLLECIDTDLRSPTVDEFTRIAYFDYWDADGLEHLLSTRDLVPELKKILKSKLLRARSAAGWQGLRRLKLVEKNSKKGIVAWKLQCAQGQPLPVYAAGQHLPLAIGANARNRISAHTYALAGDPNDTRCYQIIAGREAVTIEPTPRTLFESRLPAGVHLGDTVWAAAPRGGLGFNTQCDGPGRLFILTEGLGLGIAIGMLHSLRHEGSQISITLLHQDQAKTWSSFTPELTRLSTHLTLDYSRVIVPIPEIPESSASPGAPACQIRVMGTESFVNAVLESPANCARTSNISYASFVNLKTHHSRRAST